MVSKFIDEYLDENPNTVFLWLCPGAGGLHKQSEVSFGEVTSGIQYGDVYDFITEPDVSGHVFFINWDKINIVAYGRNKWEVCGEGILFDDEAPNREAWGGNAYHPDDMMKILLSLA